jgi:hypothetical protein
MKKVMILLCALTVGVIFATENEKTEAKEKQLTELSVLLQPTKINKVVVKAKWSIVCSDKYNTSNNSTDTVMVNGSDIRVRSVNNTTGEVTYHDIDVVTAINICNMQ